MTRSGLTIMEVMVATAIFAVVLAMVMESMTASMSSFDLGNVKDELVDDAAMVCREIELDLSASGWHLADRTDVDEPVPLVADAMNDPSSFTSYDPSAGGWNHLGNYQPPSTLTTGVAKFAFDRTRTYYPFVQQQDPPVNAPTPDQSVGKGSVNATYPNAQSWAYSHREQAFRWCGELPWQLLPSSNGQQSAAGATGDISGTSATLTDEEDRRSYHARSRELLFLRTTVTGWSKEVTKLQPVAGFNGTVDEWKSAAASAAIVGSGSATSGQLLQDKLTRERLDILFISGWEPDPVDVGLMTIRTNSSGIKMKNYGIPLESGMIDSLSNGSQLIRPKWDTMDLQTKPADPGNPTGPQVVKTPAENGVPTNFRVYQYAVIPPGINSLLPLDQNKIEKSSLGRLVRAYSSKYSGAGVPTMGTGQGEWIAYDPTTQKGMVIDKILSDNVVRIVFDTARHDGSLSMNQVRMRMYMAKWTQVGQPVLLHRIVEVVFHLGTRNGSADIYYDGEALDAQNPIPFVR